MIGRSDKAVICKHPALEKFAYQQVVSDAFEFSYELAHAANRWHLGDRQDNIINFDHYRQTFVRRYCYPDSLILESGYPSEMGMVVRRDANIIIRHLIKWYQAYDTILPDPTDPTLAKSLDEVLIYGALSFKAIRLMNTLYNLKTAGEKNKYADGGLFQGEGTHFQQTDLNLDIFTIVPENEQMKEMVTEFALLNKLHINPYWRKHFEQLMKYGFVSLQPMPKEKTGYGYGRAKLGASLTPWGLRFYELYLERYDPAVKKARQTQAEFEEYQRESGR